MQPEQGGLQGDGAMAPQFGQAYEHSLQEWAQNTVNTILADDPITSNTLHVGTTMYADEKSDINIITRNTMVNTADNRNNSLNQRQKRHGHGPEHGQGRTLTCHARYRICQKLTRID
mgnify:CR=1 FL=1